MNAVSEATTEVARPVITAILTTVVSFLPIFFMEGVEAKLFIPLAWTKTFALLASLVLALTLLPLLALFFLNNQLFNNGNRMRYFPHFLVGGTFFLGACSIYFFPWLGVALLVVATYRLLSLYANLYSPPHAKRQLKEKLPFVLNGLIVASAGLVLAYYWRPWSPNLLGNVLGLTLMMVLILGGFRYFYRQYPRLLKWALQYKLKFLMLPLLVLVLGLFSWFGFAKMFLLVPKVFSLDSLWAEGSLSSGETWVTSSFFWKAGERLFPGLQREFMPKFDEGTFLYMPTAAAHLSIGGNAALLQEIDKRIQAIPEVELAVGKIGRVESALDPAPLNMVETLIAYKPEYGFDEKGERVRQWRSHIKDSDDLWGEIVAATKVLGMTSAPKDYPISIRNVMLQTGIRSSLAVKLSGSDLDSLEAAGRSLEKALRELEHLGIRKETVAAEKVIGKPYLEIVPHPLKLADYGLNRGQFLTLVEMAIGGSHVTRTVEGRESYDVLLRYQRERRDSLEALYHLPFYSTTTGERFVLKDVAEVAYKPGPAVIRSENGFLTSFIVFGKSAGVSEGEVVRRLKEELERRLKDKSLKLPSGTHYSFAGTYLHQIRSEKRLGLIIPLSIVLIFLLLMFQFKSLQVTALIFSSIVIALSGGMVLLSLYGQEWFLDVPFIGDYLRGLFNVRSYHLSVAVWVGFLALFGIASDDGVMMATYLEKSFAKIRKGKVDVKRIRQAVLEGAQRRARPCLMTSATTLIALIPIITSRGRGSDVMIPMALPILGGMLFVLITIFLVPVGFAYFKERELLVKTAEE